MSLVLAKDKFLQDNLNENIQKQAVEGKTTRVFEET